MENALLIEVQTGLQKHKGRWKQIAEELRGEASYTWISAVGRGDYESEPMYSRLQAVKRWLDEHQEARA